MCKNKKSPDRFADRGFFVYTHCLVGCECGVMWYDFLYEEEESEG